MKPFLLNLSFATMLATTFILSPISLSGALAVEPAATAPLVSAEFSVEGDDSGHDVERKEVESVLNVIETEWNAHDIKAVMAHYAEDYVNNDGLDKKAVQKLTEDFWKTYPDAHATSKTKHIRIEGNYATIESRDVSVATTEMQGMPSKGELQSVSEGQQYMKRLGNAWRIIGDRIDYEKVKVAFGLAKQLDATFTGPEQVKAGKQFSAKLEVNLPPGLGAIGSITNQALTFPQRPPLEKTRELLEQPQQPPILERVMAANNENRNELLTATIILVNPGRKMMGLSFLTRRLNVVPDLPESSSTATAQAAESSSDKVASENSKEKSTGDKSDAAAAGESKTPEQSNGGEKAAEHKPADEKPMQQQSEDKSGESKAGDQEDKADSPAK